MPLLASSSDPSRCLQSHISIPLLFLFFFSCPLKRLLFRHLLSLGSPFLLFHLKGCGFSVVVDKKNKKDATSIHTVGCSWGRHFGQHNTCFSDSLPRCEYLSMLCWLPKLFPWPTLYCYHNIILGLSCFVDTTVNVVHSRPNPPRRRATRGMLLLRSVQRRRQRSRWLIVNLPYFETT